MTSSALLSGLRSMLYVSIGNGLYVERKEVGEPDATFYVPVWTGSDFFWIEAQHREELETEDDCQFDPDAVPAWVEDEIAAIAEEEYVRDLIATLRYEKYADLVADDFGPSDLWLVEGGINA